MRLVIRENLEFCLPVTIQSVGGNTTDTFSPDHIVPWLPPHLIQAQSLSVPLYSRKKSLVEITLTKNVAITLILIPQKIVSVTTVVTKTHLFMSILAIHVLVFRL